MPCASPCMIFDSQRPNADVRAYPGERTSQLEAALHVQVYCLKALRAIESGHGIDPTYRDYKPDDPAVKALLTRDISSAMKDPYKAAVEDCLIITMKVRRGPSLLLPGQGELGLGLQMLHASQAAFGDCLEVQHPCEVCTFIASWDIGVYPQAHVTVRAAGIGALLRDSMPR